MLTFVAARHTNSYELPSSFWLSLSYPLTSQSNSARVMRSLRPYSRGLADSYTFTFILILYPFRSSFLIFRTRRDRLVKLPFILISKGHKSIVILTSRWIHPGIELKENGENGNENGLCAKRYFNKHIISYEFVYDFLNDQIELLHIYSQEKYTWMAFHLYEFAYDFVNYQIELLHIHSQEKYTWMAFHLCEFAYVFVNYQIELLHIHSQEKYTWMAFHLCEFAYDFVNY